MRKQVLLMVMMTNVKRVPYLAVLLAATGASSLCASAQEVSKVLPRGSAALVVDAVLDDSFWQDVPAEALTPVEDGVPPELGGHIRFGVRGGELCFGARLPEPGGKVLARSIGRNPDWEQDALELPPVEDLIEFLFRAEGRLSLQVNPWGAYRLELDGEPVPDTHVSVAARVSAEGWIVEGALPLAMLAVDRDDSSAQIPSRVERMRSRRPLAPEFRWSWPPTGETAVLAWPVAGAADRSPGTATFNPPLIGNSEPPLFVGKILRTPPVVADWDHESWKDVPDFELDRNEPNPRPPLYPTRIKWQHDGERLALLIRVSEPEPVAADSGGRDADLSGDDHLAIYLATSGSRFLEFLVNPAGAVRDSLGAGPRITRLQAGPDVPVKVQTEILYGAWIARIDIPLAECAALLEEPGIPDDWRVLIARHRAARPGEAAENSALPAPGAGSFYGPLRYRRVRFTGAAPARLAAPSGEPRSAPAEELSQQLKGLDSNVWPAAYRRANRVRTMLQRWQEARIERAVLEERSAWSRVETREDWEAYRNERTAAFERMVGARPPAGTPLDVRVTQTLEGDGYRLLNLVYQSRAGFYVAANLFLPAGIAQPAPAIILQHSHHFPRPQGEIQDMGRLWARAGAAVLAVEQMGFGERVETTPWYRQAYASRHTFKKQLALIGDTRMGWMAWDLIRAVDVLAAREEIDANRILVLGSVAGGSEAGAVAAALDPRISGVVAYNYDEGDIRLDGDYPGEIEHQISPWFVTASIAPRRYVRAFEFGWEGAEPPDYSQLWFDGWGRSRRVWDFYDARENLASAQGYGLIRLSMERASHCLSIGPQQRKDLHAIFARWLGIQNAQAEDSGILPDSQLSSNRNREPSARQEALRRRPPQDLRVISPAVAAELPRRQLHQIAYEAGAAHLEKARAGRHAIPEPQRAQSLRDALSGLLGDIEPAASPPAETIRQSSVDKIEVEAIALQTEPGIHVPLLLLRPTGSRPSPVVIAVGRAGKRRALDDHAAEFATLLEAGVAVCLPDLQGTGETAASPDLDDRHAGELEIALGNTLLGARLKDLRSVLRYLRGRSEIDGRNMALWGFGSKAANSPGLLLDELQYESGPHVQFQADPMGAHLALLAGVFEPEVTAIAVRGGLSGYLSVEASPFTYVPMDVVVPGILQVGDITDVAAAVAPRPLLVEAMVDGRNVLLDDREATAALGAAAERYESLDAKSGLLVRSEPESPATWLAERLGKR